MVEKYKITGLVQGIGFRPDVKRIAERLGIRGSVKNTGGAVEIDAQGEPERLRAFRAAIKSLPMPIITSFSAEETDGVEYDGFAIVPSDAENTDIPLITPDITVCDSCLAEFENRENRRYRHPFISCTRCGPRYSVIEALPYDRHNITMSDFLMCAECGTEYADIKNIRCHAQTIACNKCGPVLSYTISGDPLDEAVKTIKRGGVAAVKDIGGYHLVCSAFDEGAARRIRKIKQRDAKPFAVMFNNITEIREFAFVSDMEERTLKSAARPIVLVKSKNNAFANSVCSSSDSIGAFLPCNPVQYYLTKKCGALVMTSANVSGEPIITDDERIKALRQSAGGFEILSHNRRIVTPLDDSVCRIIRGRVQLIRRARGYTPLPVEIDMKENIAVFAAGGDLKASFCYAKDGRAYMSQYFGDLENVDAYNVWKNNIKRLGNLLGIKPDRVIRDMHPGYFSARYAEGEMLQHHYAHMASVMAEHKLTSALGFIFDGTGYGTDGNIWGGEIIRYENEFRRVGGLEYTPLLGGDSSAKDSALTSQCYLIAAGIEPAGESAQIIKAAIKNNVNTIPSSSMGRLFDAVSAILGICGYNSYEGECAIMLENAASAASAAYPLTLPLNEDGRWHTAALIRQIYDARSRNEDINSLALGFHAAIAGAVCDYAENRNEKNIVLSGGVFANRIITEHCIDRLEGKGYNVYINEQVPTNDGGIALGQAWYLSNR